MKKLCFLLLILLLVLTGCSQGQTDSSAENNEVSSAINTADVLPDESGTSSFLAGNESTIPDATEQPKQNTSPSETVLATEKPKEANTSKPQSSTSSSGTNKPADNSKTPSSTTTKPESSQTPAKTEPPEEKPKFAFAKPFDVATMKSELIAYGTSIGMTHITNFSEDYGGGQITPDGTTWLPPHETWMYDSSSASKLKQDLCDRIKRWKNEGEKTFTLWFEKDSNHSGDYIIYVIIA